jgi:hypothetical protein
MPGRTAIKGLRVYEIIAIEMSGKDCPSILS